MHFGLRKPELQPFFAIAGEAVIILSQGTVQPPFRALGEKIPFSLAQTKPPSIRLKLNICPDAGHDT
jgi:hypothetical protein